MRAAYSRGFWTTYFLLYSYIFLALYKQRCSELLRILVQKSRGFSKSMAKYPLTKVSEPDDPNRCQGVYANGQCNNIAVEGSEYCGMHGGNKAGEDAKKKAANLYRLQTFQNRVGDFATNPKVKGLREDIGILRMVLEMTLNRCKDESDLIMFSPKISELVMKIEKVVSSAHRLESNMGELLDKMAAMQLGEEIVTLITEGISEYTQKVIALVPEDNKAQVQEIMESELIDNIAEGLAKTIGAFGEEAA